MKTYIAGLLAIGGIVAMTFPSQANAGLFNWFPARRIGYPAPLLTAFVGQNIGMGSWDELNEEKKIDLQLVQQTAVIAINNTVTTVQKKVTSATPLKIHLTLATGYSSTVDQTDSTPFITARGTLVRDGIVAANFLPFGTVIRIPDLFGDKTFVVEDRMHNRFSDRIDIWFPTREEALEFGAQRVKIEIVS